MISALRKSSLWRWPVLAGLSIAIVLALLPALNFAIEIAPATAADIVAALGPDSNGLLIRQDELPDLFTLTSSRIDENATRFFVEQVYKDGRWKDGKAVIEYARDLSYTLVSIYDKHGKRQRLYSVKTQYAEHLARSKSRSSPRATEEVSAPEVSEPPTETASSRRESSVRTIEPSTGSSGAGYEWDEAKGDYVYKGPTESRTEVASDPRESSSRESARRESSSPSERSSSASEPTPSSSRHRRHRRIVDSTETASSASAERGTSKSFSSSEVWVPGSSKSAAARTAKGVVVAAAGTTWVERKEVVSAPEPEAPSRKSSTSRRRRETAAPAVEEVVLPVRNIDELPDKPVTSRRSRRRAEKEAPAPVPAKETPIQVASKPSTVEPAREERRAAEPSREERRSVEPSREERRSAEPVREERQSAETQPEPVRAPRQDVPAPEPSKERPGVLNEALVPSTEELLADEEPPVSRSASAAHETAPAKSEPTKPLTTESDAWVPKPVKTPTVVEPVIPETKVAMLPKKTEDPLEKLLKMSETSKTPVNKEADAWVPKSSAVGASNEADLNKEIQRVRAEERRRAMPEKKAPIKRDVNNPEEGVLPVSSFEKFSGSMYGRHREYERRFYPGKLKKSSAPQHDFYVDEVDRKKEFHNIYFYQYQKGKPPRLVAVQRHDKVSFRSNYDIDKEDKGKLSTYN